MQSFDKRTLAWINFTLHHAREHGWEPFILYRLSDHESLEKNASFFHHGHWIYQGSVSELRPGGITFSWEDAIALSEQRWSPTLQIGTRPDLYAEFEAQYYKQQNLHSKL